MEQKYKGSSLVNVSSILMIIGAILAIILMIVMLIGIAALMSLLDPNQNIDILYAAGGIGILSGVLQLVAGIMGVKYNRTPAKAGTLIVWGSIVAILTIVSTVLTTVGGEAFPTVSFIVGLILPALYIFGAVQLKKAAYV